MKELKKDDTNKWNEILRLTKDHTEIIQRVAEGMTEKEISIELKISERAVDSRKIKIMDRFEDTFFWRKMEMVVAYSVLHNLIDTSKFLQDTCQNLTYDERQILTKKAEGYYNNQISEFTGLSTSTIRNITGKVIEKLSAKNHYHAIAVAVANRQIVPSLPVESEI